MQHFKIKIVTLVNYKKLTIMKGKIKLFIAMFVLATFLFDACVSHKSAYQTPRKGKHGGKHRIKTDMGGYL